MKLSSLLRLRNTFKFKGHNIKVKKHLFVTKYCEIKNIYLGLIFDAWRNKLMIFLCLCMAKINERYFKECSNISECLFIEHYITFEIWETNKLFKSQLKYNLNQLSNSLIVLLKYKHNLRLQHLFLILQSHKY